MVSRLRRAFPAVAFVLVTERDPTAAEWMVGLTFEALVFRHEEVLMRSLSFAVGMIAAVALAILFSPGDLEAQCGDCELQGTKYYCNGTHQPNEAPYCDGVWPFRIACNTCEGLRLGPTTTPSEDSERGYDQNRQLQAIVVAGIAIPGTYPVPASACRGGRVQRVYMDTATKFAPSSQSGQTLIEVWAKPEPSAIKVS